MESGLSDLPVELLKQISASIDLISDRASSFACGDDYRASHIGMITLDSICMQFIAIGECLKRFDRETKGYILPLFPGVPWKKVMGLRDIVAHRYFDIDADQIQWIVKEELGNIKSNINDMIEYLQSIKR